MNGTGGAWSRGFLDRLAPPIEAIAIVVVAELARASDGIEPIGLVSPVLSPVYRLAIGVRLSARAKLPEASVLLRRTV